MGIKKVKKKESRVKYILKIIITDINIKQGIRNRMASLKSNAEMQNIRKQCLQYSEGNTILIHNAVNKT